MITERDRKQFTLRPRPTDEQWAVDAAIEVLNNIAEADFLSAGAAGHTTPGGELVPARTAISFSGRAADDIADVILNYSRKAYIK